MECEDEQYGFDDSLFLSETQEYLRCALCFLVLRNPVQIICCGHKFCSVCFERMEALSKTTNAEVRCPIDRELVDLNDVRPDVAVRRLVGNLLVKCHQHERGCDWTGELSELNDHTVRCPYRPPREGNTTNTVGLSSGNLLKKLQERLESCENCLIDKDKEIASLKCKQQQLTTEFRTLRLQQQQQQEQVQSLKQQKEQQQEQVNEQLEDLKQLQTQQPQHQQQEITTLKEKNKVLERELFKVRNDHQEQLCKIQERLLKMERMHVESASSGEVGRVSDMQPTHLSMVTANTASNTVSRKLSVWMKKQVEVQYHNGDPGDATISNDSHTVEFVDAYYGYDDGLNYYDAVTVSAPHAVVPPLAKVWYEVECGGYSDVVGWVTSDFPSTDEYLCVGTDKHSYGFQPFQGIIHHDHKSKSYGGNGLGGNRVTVGVALDLVKGEILFSVDGRWTKPKGVAFTGVSTEKEFFPAIGGYDSIQTFNFGDHPFNYEPPDATFKSVVDVL